MQSCVDRRRINEKCRSDDLGVVGVRVRIEKGAVSNAKKAFETAPSGADIAALAEREGFEPSCAFAQTDFEKYNGCHNPSLCVPNFRKIRRFFRFSSAHLSDLSEK